MPKQKEITSRTVTIREKKLNTTNTVWLTFVDGGITPIYPSSENEDGGIYQLAMVLEEGDQVEMTWTTPKESQYPRVTEIKVVQLNRSRKEIH